MWYDPLKLPIAFLTRHFFMILNRHKIFNKMLYNMPLLIQFGGQIVFDPQLTYSKDLKSNQIPSNMNTQPITAILRLIFMFESLLVFH